MVKRSCGIGMRSTHSRSLSEYFRRVGILSQNILPQNTSWRGRRHKPETDEAVYCQRHARNTGVIRRNDMLRRMVSHYKECS
jgi:hypothetical protein